MFGSDRSLRARVALCTVALAYVHVLYYCLLLLCFGFLILVFSFCSDISAGQIRSQI